ncbi:MAG: beta-galactosidase trimerization domain-containing protein [Planctomycetota bacterium]|jgi:hypothetical protein
MRSVKAIVLASLVFALCASAFCAEEAAEAVPEEGVGGSAFHKNDITYSMEVETPHVKWASRLPDGPIRGFFIPGIRYGRDMVELMQRLDLAPTTVSIDPDWDTNCWGIGDYYSHDYRGDRDDFVKVFGYVEQDITGDADFEVMLIADINGWSRMTRPTRDAILKRVQDGAGLVLIHPTVGDVVGHPFKGDEDEADIRIWDISPLAESADNPINEGGYPEYPKNPSVTEGKWEYGAPHFITAGVPLGLLAESKVPNKFFKYTANGEVLIKSGELPVLAVRTYGKGRVVAFAYHPQGFVPMAVDPVDSGVYWDYWEYYYSLLARAVLWASGRETAVTVESISAARSIEPVLAMVLNSSKPRTVEIEILVKSEYGVPLGRYTSTFELAAGTNDVRLDHAVEAAAEGAIGGRVIYDVMIREGGATLDWASTFCEWPKPAAIAELSIPQDVYKRGETLGAVVKAGGNLEGLSVRFTVADELDRVLADKRTPAAEEVPFDCDLSNYLGDYAFVAAELVGAAHALDQKRAKGVLVVQSERRPKEFVANVSFGGGRPFLRNRRGQLVRAAGARPGFVWGGAVNTGLNIPKGSFGIYWYHRGPDPSDEEGIDKLIAEYEETGDFGSLKYNVKKELYKRTEDKKFLERTPCLDDAEFMKGLREIVRGAAGAKAKYNFDYYFVGDEGSLTSYTDAVDFCWGPHTLAAFRKWLFAEYGGLDALNREWKTDFKEWNDVVPLTTKEATDSGKFTPWADHRTYMEITFANAYQWVRDAVIEGDPDGHIAVSGTQVTKSHNGCDWYRLDQIIDDFLSYGGGNQWDLHRSFAKPGSMIGYWTGYGSSGIAVQNSIWTAAVHNVLFPNIFWMYSYLDPDFTYSKSARDMGVAFKELKFEGVARLFMEAERLQDGIAVHYSMPSMHAATITGNEPAGRNFSGARDGWVRMIKDLGMQFDFVAYEQVEQGGLSSGDYGVFVMPFSMALSAEEADAIVKFAEEGGAVIADAAAGVMTERCSWREEGLLNEFFGIASTPSSARDYTVGETGDVVRTRKGQSWRINEADLADLTVVEKDLKFTTGTPLAMVGGVPVAVVRQVGKGWAIYLNVAFDDYSRQRRRGFGGGAHRCLMRSILTKLGVRPEVEIVGADNKPLEQAIVARYRIGDSTVLAVVKENVGVEGTDGVTYYEDSDLGRLAMQEITVRLPRAAYVTDVRTGEKLGYTEAVRTSITVGGAKVLALSTADNSLEISGPETAARGEQPVFAIRSQVPTKRVVRCHFFAPDGSFVPHYATNIVVTGGEGSVVLPTALNDRPGDWVLKAIDLLTGAAAEGEIALE